MAWWELKRYSMLFTSYGEVESGSVRAEESSATVSEATGGEGVVKGKLLAESSSFERHMIVVTLSASEKSESPIIRRLTFFLDGDARRPAHCQGYAAHAVLVWWCQACREAWCMHVMS